MTNTSISLTEEQRDYLKEKNLSATDIFRKGLIFEQFKKGEGYNNHLNNNRLKNLIEFHKDRITYLLKEISFHESQIKNLKKEE